MSKKKEIYRHTSPWTLYGLGWSGRSDRGLRLATGSLIEDAHNKVQVLVLDDEKGQFRVTHSTEHVFPPNKLLWIPDTNNLYPDLVATCSDYVRLFRLCDKGQMTVECILNNYKSPGYGAALSSFDWNEADPNLIGTASVDTSCTIWSLQTGKVVGKTSTIQGHVKTQLIAHDKEVCDIAFNKSLTGHSKYIFASVGYDASVRVFDLRHLEHSVITYEDKVSRPMMRVAWNRRDANQLATFALDSTDVIILDIRFPCVPLAHLNSHRASVNGISWSPQSNRTMVTGSNDHQALIWDVNTVSAPNEDPSLAYTAGGEISQVHWSVSWPDWIGICYGKTVEILRV